MTYTTALNNIKTQIQCTYSKQKEQGKLKNKNNEQGD